MRKVCTQLDLTFKLESTRSLKAAERHSVVNIVGPSSSRLTYQRTLVPEVCHIWLIFCVHTLLLCVIFSAGIFMCPPLWPHITLWRLWFILGLLILSHFWMKSNGIPMMVLDTWLTKPWCGRRGVLKGALGTPWKWIEWNWDIKKDQRWIVNIWMIDLRFIALNATKPVTTHEDVKRTYVFRIWNLSLI
jgi:hypothetical protein